MNRTSYAALRAMLIVPLLFTACGDTEPERPDNSAPDDRYGFYADVDGDGFGAGDIVWFRTPGVPSGYARTDGDCAPEDEDRWRFIDVAGVDLDGDGRFVTHASTECFGAAVTVPYTPGPVPQPEDCDDEDASRSVLRDAYVDVDGDGWGAGSAERVCASDEQLPNGYVIRADDCAPDDPAAFARLPYSDRDADQDGATVSESGTICTGDELPAGYLTTSGPPDCDDDDRTLSALRSYYVDADLDGYGVAPSMEACLPAQLPSGFVSNDLDCDDTNDTVWDTYEYAHRDADGDGHTIPDQGHLCVGTNVPAGYESAASPTQDCDDNNAVLFLSRDGYADVDGDGFGAGALQGLCTDGDLPTGYVTTDGDCAPSDPTRFVSVAHVAVDRDGDSVTVPEVGAFCTAGALPPPYSATANGLDCDDADPNRFELTLLFDDGDLDGVGAGSGRKLCLGIILPAGTSPYGDDPDDLDPAISVDDELIDLIVLHL